MIPFLTILLRLGLALLLGIVVGFERESRDHTAGMRTIALIALASCLFTLISAFGFLGLLSVPHIQVDPTRIASYIVAGIGFLGAGSIFFSREEERVNGLTTAAVIWTVAAIGMACGAGLLLVAIAATVLTLFILVGLRFVERFMSPRRSKLQRLRLQIEATSPGGHVIGHVCDVLAHAGTNVETLEIQTKQGSETLTVFCRFPETPTLALIVDELQALPGIQSVHTKVRGMPKARY